VRGRNDYGNAPVIIVGLASFEMDGCVLTLIEETNVNLAESEEAREGDFEGRVEIKRVDFGRFCPRAR
jgi:hypothetical protein